MKTILKYALTIAPIILALDFIFFVCWIMSGQMPEGFYFGGITGSLLKLII